MKVEFETFNPPYEDMMTILGRTKDQHNIHWAGEDTNPPYVSLCCIFKSSGRKSLFRIA